MYADTAVCIDICATKSQKLNKIDQAYETAKDLCSRHPLYDVGWNTLGVMEMERGDLQAAQSSFLRSLEIRPRSISVWVNLGNVAFLAKDYSVAKYWWEQVLLETPSHAHAQQGLDEIRKIETDTP